MDIPMSMALFSSVYSAGQVTAKSNGITMHQFVDTLPWLIPLYIAAGLLILVCVYGIVMVISK